ncbi:Protease propeptide/inhibitor [Zalerion maritima]|uniref:Protease propeptide/inhibitor n=1 Tax=Zalerion maritima TaxID=339359 RepID=A0AAD5S3A9_9PEZI|nr:Protease propeptide/inhibitor [Zalerion maritima]
MKFTTIFAAALAATQGAFAADIQKSVIVTYDMSTPDSIVNAAMDSIKSAGGIVTHEYKLIKGFSAKAPEKILHSVQTWGNRYNALIEEDEVVSVQI